jgi:hypothetical protein
LGFLFSALSWRRKSTDGTPFVPNVSSGLRTVRRRFIKSPSFQRFCRLLAVGIAPAKVVPVIENNLTKLKYEIDTM